MPRPSEPAYFIPTPSRTTLFFRTFFPWQAIRFVWINLKMLRMISIGHHGKMPLYQWAHLEPAEKDHAGGHRPPPVGGPLAATPAPATGAGGPADPAGR